MSVLASGTTCWASWTVTNKHGLHARPAALLVSASRRYMADIVFESDGRKVSGKSILGILSLDASFGTVVHAQATGTDAALALRAIGELFACDFHEQSGETPAPIPALETAGACAGTAAS